MSIDKYDDHLNLSVWEQAEKLREKGYSVYELIIAATYRAKEISTRRNKLDQAAQKLTVYPMKPINTALFEVVDELNNEGK